MKNLTALALILSLGAPAYAGGPVVIEEAFEAEPAPKLSPGEKIAILVGIVTVGVLIASGGGSSDVCNGDEPAPTPEPCR